MNSGSSSSSSNRESVVNARKQCVEDYVPVFDTLNAISLVVSVAVVIYMVRKRAKTILSFPNNFGIITLACTGGLCLCNTLSLVFGRSNVHPSSTGFYGALCDVQAFALYILRAVLFLHWSMSMIVMYLIIVRSVSIQTIRKKQRLYYGILVALPCLQTMLLAIFDKYGGTHVFQICSLRKDALAWKMSFTASQNFFGLLVFFALFLPALKQMYDATKIDQNQDRVVLLQDTILHHVAQSIYLAIWSCSLSLNHLNQVLAKEWDGAFESNYLANTTYTYCAMAGIIVPFGGTAFGLIYLTSIGWMKKCVKRCCKDTKHPVESSDETDHMYEMKTPKPQMGAGLPSSFDKNAQSVVSIPPDTKHRRLYHQAHSAYVENVILNVREELEALHDETALYSEVTNVDTSEVVVDAQMELAKGRWVGAQ